MTAFSLYYESTVFDPIELPRLRVNFCLSSCLAELKTRRGDIVRDLMHLMLSPGQSEEIDRVERLYPHLRDDAFVRQHLHEWLS